MIRLDFERQFAIKNIDDARDYLRKVISDYLGVPKVKRLTGLRIVDEAAEIIEQLDDIKGRIDQLFETKKAGE